MTMNEGECFIYIARGPCARWYVVAWRVLWFIPAHLALFLFLVFVAAGWGVDTAKRAWGMVAPGGRGHDFTPVAPSPGSDHIITRIIDAVDEVRTQTASRTITHTASDDDQTPPSKEEVLRRWRQAVAENHRHR